MVTLSAQIPDRLNSSFMAYAKRHNLQPNSLVAAALQKLLEAENSTIHVFESDDDIRQFANACGGAQLAKLN